MILYSYNYASIAEEYIELLGSNVFVCSFGHKMAVFHQREISVNINPDGRLKAYGEP